MVPVRNSQFWVLGVPGKNTQGCMSPQQIAFPNAERPQGCCMAVMLAVLTLQVIHRCPIQVEGENVGLRESGLQVGLV